MIGAAEHVFAWGMIVLAATSLPAHARDIEVSDVGGARTSRVPFNVVVFPRIFIVESSGDPTTTTPGSNIDIEAQPDSTLSFDIYTEFTGGIPVDVSGFQFLMACTSTGGDGGAITYDPGSVTATGADFFLCGASFFAQDRPGDCTISDEPGGLAAASPGTCPLSTPVLVGTISYIVPPDAGTSDPVGNPYVIALTGSYITDSAQNPLPDLRLDGANVTVHKGDLSLNVAPSLETATQGNTAAQGNSVQQGDTVTVTLDVANLSTPINGVEALIHYDTALLSLVEIEPEDLGLTAPAQGWGEVDQSDVAGDTSYAVIINGGSTDADATVATLTFTALTVGSTNITFLGDNPPNHPTLVTMLTRADTALTIDPGETPSGKISIIACDDGLPCTTDTFDDVNLICVFTPNPGTCVIDGACYDDGDSRPVNDCEECNAMIDQTAWTPRSAGAACGTPAGLCDAQDTCDGSGICVDNGFLPDTTECRIAAGDCDLAELCPGDGPGCPTDVKMASGTECRAATGDCDVAEVCDGSSNDCPLDGYVDGTVECRPAAGDCDAEEFCPGDGPDCPADVKKTSGTLCRAAVDDCDVAEVCDGSSNDCPFDGYADGSVQCRASVGNCDVAESCPGDGPGCPADAKKGAGTECRGAASECDVAEVCDGVSSDCPIDEYQPADTSCEVDGHPCTVDFCDGIGACATVDITPCLTANLQIEALIGDLGVYGSTTAYPDGSRLNRQVNFVVTTCGVGVDTRVETVTFAADVGNGVGTGSALLIDVDPNADYLSVWEGHTLRKLVAVDLTVSDTVDVFLTPGDFSNAYVPLNNLSDIQDFAILAIVWNELVNPELPTLADATGDGLQSMGDFTAIQVHFAEAGDAPDLCLAAAGFAQNVPVGAPTDELTTLACVPGRTTCLRMHMTVDELMMPNADYADVNADGMIDVRDIRAFAELHALPLLPEFSARLTHLERADTASLTKPSPRDRGTALPTNVGSR